MKSVELSAFSGSKGASTYYWLDEACRRIRGWNGMWEGRLTRDGR